jgi:hypothetical protein
MACCRMAAHCPGSGVPRPVCDGGGVGQLRMGDAMSEALRLADALDERRVTRWVHATGETPKASGYAVDAECAQAAAELRRLHAVNEELLEALKAMLAIWEDRSDASDKARAAIAKATGETK